MYNDPKVAAEETKELLKLKKTPTCILYPDDYAAFGGISAIRETGMSVPDDISIAGFDGIPVTEILEPPLTTYSQDTGRIGKCAAAKLIDLIERPRVTNRDIEQITGNIREGRSVKAL